MIKPEYHPRISPLITETLFNIIDLPHLASLLIPEISPRSYVCWSSPILKKNHKQTKKSKTKQKDNNTLIIINQEEPSLNVLLNGTHLSPISPLCVSPPPFLWHWLQHFETVF